MDDPRHFGLQLADKTVARMEGEGLSSGEAAISAAKEILQRSDEMVAAGTSSEEAATWTQVVTVAYGARLGERIKGSEEVTALARNKGGTCPGEDTSS